MLITCIGKDSKIHACYPWETKCSCGVLKDKRIRTENIDYSKHFWCYECDHALEEESEEMSIAIESNRV